MEVKVELLNVLLYKNKNNVECTRVGYRLLDKERSSNTEKFKGYTELSCYIEGRKVFDALDLSFCGTALEFVFNESINPQNPMRKKVTLAEIKCNGKSVCLL